MVDSTEDESDDDSYCGMISPVHELALPNFKNAYDIDIELILNVIESNIPHELRYRGYVPSQKYTFGFDEVELKVSVDLHKLPDPIVSLVTNVDYALPRKVIDGIRWALRTMIVDELDACAQTPTLFQSGLIVLRLLEETTSHLREYRRSICHASTRAKDKYWDLSKIKDVTPLLDSGLEMKGVDLDTVHGAATHILGKTPAQICHDILPDWRIMHCENILRNDLKSRFLQSQTHLRAKLLDVPTAELKACVPMEHRRLRGGGGDAAAKEQLVEYLVKPRLTFHGTRHETIPSIVQHGFLKPGNAHPATKKALPVYNGSAYGAGIYSSPEPWYALMYSRSGMRTKSSELPGLKLLVCAAVMGRTAMLGPDDSWQEQTEPWPRADSHVNQSQLAYIVFDSARILPCYVLHLDWVGRDDDDIEDFLARFQRSSRSGRAKPRAVGEETPGDRQRKKEELVAKGKKFFAAGFGPVAGSRIVIEDVAEVDDDEEDYGDYQDMRINAQFSNTSIWDDGWGRGSEAEDGVGDALEGGTALDGLEGETAFDEYADARKARLNRKKPRMGGAGVM